MQTSDHILAKEGILTTFSIAKRVTAKDIKKICDKLKKSKVKEEKIQELLTMAIVKDTQKKLDIYKIPGLIPDSQEESNEKKRIMELTYFASMIAKKLSDKNIDKYYSCFIINAVVNMLQLTEEDFNNFHQKFSKFKNGNNTENEDNDDGTESYE